MGFIGGAVLLLCLFAGATLFFSVNAITLRTYSLVRLQEAFQKLGGDDALERVDRLVANADKLALTCAFYRLVFNLAGLLLLVMLGSRLHVAATYVLAFLAGVIIFSVFSLAIPDALAKYAGEQVLSRTHGVLVACSIVAAPVIYVLQFYDGFVRRLVGVPEPTPQEEHEEKQEEFLEDLEQHRMEGAVDAEEQEMIENVLDLRERMADEIMTPRTDLIAVEVSADLPTVLGTIRRAGHSRLPVYEGSLDNVVGLIYAKDLLEEIGKDPAGFRLRDRMREAYFVPETKSLRALLREFQQQKLHMAVVLDEYGGTAGIVTLEDILEELVGEIADEYEKTEPESIRKIDDNTIDVDARTYVEDLNEQYSLDLPDDEDYDTLGGFVFSRLGYVPKAGESFEYKNLKFTIVSAEPRRVKRVRIQIQKAVER